MGGRPGIGLSPGRATAGAGDVRLYVYRDEAIVAAFRDGEPPRYYGTAGDALRAMLAPQVSLHLHRTGQRLPHTWDTSLLRWLQTVVEAGYGVFLEEHPPPRGRARAGGL